jgi:sugar/nucleoside kinase (ribokinase family)
MLTVQKKYAVFGIENPLVDILYETDDKTISSLGMHKGIMQLIDIKTRTFLLDKIPASKRKVSAGGSCANTIFALADFGLRTVYSGAIGNDEFGDTFKAEMEKAGVNPVLARKGLPTGTSIILITKDTERTMNTYLGACQEFSREDLDEKKLLQSGMLYFTGYMWDTPKQKEAITRAIFLAKKNKLKIIFDVADPFAVDRYKGDFLDIIKNDVDFVFANEKEASHLCGETDIEEVTAKMMAIAKAGAIKIGAKGSIVFSNGKYIKIPGFKVKAVDTTGAGDMYAAGFIYGMAKNYDLERCGRIASYVSSRVVEQVGARLNYSLRGKIDNI